MSSVRTNRTDVDANVAGISLLVWNPVYDNIDITVYNQDIQLPYYKFPYFFDEQSLLARIEVVER